MALALLPGTAMARVRPASRQSSPASRQIRPEVSAQFSLKGTNGFEVAVGVTDRRRLSLSALKFGDVLEAASYSLRVHPNRGSDIIVARLGRLGHIDMRFVPGKVRREKPPKGCHGAKTVIEQGHFVGVIAFHGEDGFTEVHSRRAVGAVTRTPALTCPSTSPPPNLKKLRHELEVDEATKKAEESGKEENDEEVEVLSVGLSAKARGGRVTLTASKVALKEKYGKGFSLTNIAVFGSRHRGRIKEEGVAAYLFGNGSALLVPNRKKPTSEAVLKPPSPFSGSATFRRHPKKAPTWTGDLRIDLPSFGQVRLAGRGTHASLCEGTACLLRGIPSDRSSLLRRLAGPATL